MIHVYTPQSGGRTIAVQPSRYIVVVDWPNGSCHVVGDVVDVTVPAAEPRKWWREAARLAAESVVAELGGVAWDVCGDIHLAVQRRRAPEAARAMLEVCPHPQGLEAQIAASLVRQGVRCRYGPAGWRVPPNSANYGADYEVRVSEPTDELLDRPVRPGEVLADGTTVEEVSSEERDAALQGCAGALYRSGPGSDEWASTVVAKLHGAVVVTPIARVCWPAVRCQWGEKTELVTYRGARPSSIRGGVPEGGGSEDARW